MVRSGLVARQNWPSSSEIGTSPTHIQTKTKPKTGLVSRSWPAISARPAQAYDGQHQQPRDQPGGRMVDDRVRPGSGRPPSSANRGCRQASSSTTKESASASAAPDQYEAERQWQVVPGRDPVQGDQHQCAGD